MSSQTFRLVLLVSCAHALVHIYELSFPAVELDVARQFHTGQQTMGVLGNCWRLPFGLGAMLAGWLVDRYGAKWLLIIYLSGCAASSALAAWAPDLGAMFAAMFLMGSFASIYHPAGLALISHETTPDNRPLALGYHGIFGSLGIAAAPLLAGLCLAAMSWQGYYLVLVVPGVVLAVVFAFRLVEHHRQTEKPAPEVGQVVGDPGNPYRSPESESKAPSTPTTVEETDGHWRAFFVLTISGMLSGFVYAALMNFLPRYLSNLPLRPSGIGDDSFRNFMAAGILLIGVVGQYTSGRFARAGHLERQLAAIVFINAPLLVGMALADGNARLAAAGAVVLLQFMQQPIYNSLVAQFVPRRRRSLGYGFSNMLAFGIGSFGASFAGYAKEGLLNFGTLAAFSIASGLVALVLAKMKK